ncbi:MAG: hypothetical protein K1X75_14500 [Leptospirales bacterium]|nr:hypothetical protein [Leptospirales bacterium]
MGSGALTARWQRIAAALALWLTFASLAAEGAGQSEDSERLQYNGEVFARGFVLTRDLPAAGSANGAGGLRAPQSYAEYIRCNISPELCKQSPQRESQDYYGMRLRLDASFRASDYVDALFGIEVGEFVFGREQSRSGPGSGGRGEGASNLETRRLLLRAHDRENLRVLDIGVFSFSTPGGLVLARSGAGARFYLDPDLADLSLDTVYFRAVDSSQIDGDSNGFSDRNFADIDIAAFRLRYSGLRWIRPELYAVYRNDGDLSREDPLQTDAERSRVYWAGLYAQFQRDWFEATLHGVGNWGRFERPLSENPRLIRIAVDRSDPLSAPLASALQAPIQKQYRINAGAWQIEIAARIFDQLRLALVSTGASGRPEGDQEPDGSSPAYRADQFRTAGSSYQFSEIAIDDSGGYSLFVSGRLTGVAAEGIRIRYRPLEQLEIKLAYYRLRSIHPITLRYNSNYNFLQLRSPSSFLGEESNLRLQYDIFRDLKLFASFAWFNAAAGYKSLADARYGDYLAEAQFGVTQEF